VTCTAETSIVDYVQHYTTPHETVIFYSDGVTGDHITWIGAVQFFLQKLLVNLKNVEYRCFS
jgi:hypothetical protein